MTRVTQSNEIHLFSVWYFNHIGVKKEGKTFKMNAKSNNKESRKIIKSKEAINSRETFNICEALMKSDNIF